MSASGKIRVRFAPSPTGFLHVGSARTFIFNWLFARHAGGIMILRLDDTDVERNTDASVESIFEGLKWLGLDWQEEYRQSDRLALHREMAQKIFEKGMAYRDFTPASAGEGERDRSAGPWLFNAEMRGLSREESDRRAGAGEPFALRFRVPRDGEETIRFTDAVYGEQAKSTADIEDFALLRSDAGAPNRPASGLVGWGGMPTYHMASCADDADMHISHIIRGQDHLPNTFKHILIFRALGSEPAQFAHLPLLVAPDGAKLSKRKHGSVVSVTTYRDAGFLPQAFINFLCLLGWSPKDDREFMSLDELTQAFTLENINRANAVVNFKEPAATSPAVHSEDQFDPKAVWLNAKYIQAMPVDELAERLLAIVTSKTTRGAGYDVDLGKMKLITPLIRERIRLLSDVLTVADFFFRKDLAPYDTALLVPQKGDLAMAKKVLEKAREVLAQTEFAHDLLDQALRAAAQELGVKAGQMFTPIRVAVTGRTASPGLFETLTVLGREVTLERIEKALERLPKESPQVK
ncbi:MAG: glutamate--tRNA ligase [Acidobacteriota bacterium]|nr:glutamate--tRNA ligase [Acidobacteriota bacterium]